MAGEDLLKATKLEDKSSAYFRHRDHSPTSIDTSFCGVCIAVQWSTIVFALEQTQTTKIFAGCHHWWLLGLCTLFTEIVRMVLTCGFVLVLGCVETFPLSKLWSKLEQRPIYNQIGEILWCTLSPTGNIAHSPWKYVGLHMTIHGSLETLTTTDPIFVLLFFILCVVS